MASLILLVMDTVAALLNRIPHLLTVGTIERLELHRFHVVHKIGHFFGGTDFTASSALKFKFKC